MRQSCEGEQRGRGERQSREAEQRGRAERQSREREQRETKNPIQGASHTLIETFYIVVCTPTLCCVGVWV